MGWVREGVGEDSPFVVCWGKTTLHYEKDISLAQLNDPESGFKLHERNPKYVIESTRPDEEMELLPSGVYNLVETFSGFKLAPVFPEPDLKLYRLGTVETVLKDFNYFINSRHVYEKIKRPYKRGILLYGEPGTGKTSAIELIKEEIKNHECLVFYISRDLPDSLLRELKKDTRLKVFIFEELTETIEECGVRGFLNFLDGTDSLMNSYSIATTNYPGKLPGNILRVGRFDKLIEFDDLSEDVRKKIIEDYLEREITAEELALTKEFSFAFIRELVLMILIEKMSFVDAIKELNGHKIKTATKFESNGKEDEDDNENEKWII